MYLDVVVDFTSPVPTASSPSSTMSSVEPADVVADGTCSGGLQHVKCDRHSVNMRQYHRPPSSRINAHTTKSSRQYRVNVHAYCMYVCIHESSYRLCFPICIYWRKNARSTETPCGYIQRHTYITKSSDDTCILAELLEQSSLRGLESVVASVIALARAAELKDRQARDSTEAASAPGSDRDREGAPASNADVRFEAGDSDSASSLFAGLPAGAS